MIIVADISAFWFIQKDPYSSSMSWLDKFQNSRFGRPFRNRKKLGEDEDDWCDALSSLHMDSSSSDEFVDAHEKVPVNSSPKGRKRKKTKSKNKNKKQNDSEIFGDSSSSSSTADTFTGIEGTAEIHPVNPQEEQQAQRKEKLQKRKSSKTQCPPPQPLADTHQGWKERSKSTGHDGYPFNPDNKQCSHAGFKFRSTPEISSSSSKVDEQMDTQHDQAGITERQLEQLAYNLNRDVEYRHVSSLGQQLGYSPTVVFGYCGYEKRISGILDLLRAWRFTTIKSQQETELIQALRKAELNNLAANLHHAQEGMDDPMYSRGERSTSIDKTTSQLEASPKRNKVKAMDDPMDSREEGSTSFNKPASLLEAPSQKNLVKVGISDSQLEQMAKSLLREDPQNTDTFLRKLGIKSVELDRYCDSGRQRDSSGIVRTLRAWRDKTNDKKQKNELLAALKKAKLQHLDAFLYQSEAVDVAIDSRKGSTITDKLANREAFLKSESDHADKVGISDDQLEQLAKALFDGDYRNASSLGLVLGFNQYEVKRFCGSNRPRDDSGILRMLRTWRDKMIHVVNQKYELLAALKKAKLQNLTALLLKSEEYITNDPRLQLHGQKDSRECNPESKSKASSVLNRFRSHKPVSRKPIIYLCTSFGLHSVRGIQENLRNLLEKFHHRFEITAKELPYNYRDLREFRFPAAEVGVHDAMILCHSMQNRGFLITNVENSIYDQYLHHCNKVFGQEHVAVIVHDFDCSEEILGNYMDAFQRTQPKTFQLAGFVALARNATNVQLSSKDSTKLEEFVMKIR